MRTLALAMFLSVGLLAQTTPSNLRFESGTVGQVPSGWYMGSSVAGAGFQAALVDQNCTEGSRCVMMSGPPSPPANSYGYLYQAVAATSYLSRQIRFRAAVRVEGTGTRARLWARVDRTGGGYSSLINSPDITSTQWNYFEIGVDVAPDSQQIAFGFLIYGSGKAWADDATFAVGGEDPREPPRPLSDTGLANLTAFAKLLGYVRHFHPSDQAAQTNWEAFAIQGVRTVEDAATPEDLANKLGTLVEAIAPTVRIFTGQNRPALPSELQPPSFSEPQVVRWNHYGIGLAASGSIYRSERQKSPVRGGQLPAGFEDPAKPFEAEMGRGLSALVPLSLYADAQGTLPHKSLDASNLAYGTVNDRATRLAGVMLAWNVFQHFYPYFEVVQTDWPAAFADALRTAATDTAVEDYQRTLQRLIAALKDGHGRVSSPLSVVAVPLVWDWVENQLIVTRVKDEQGQSLARGDRVLRVDGKPAEEAMAGWQELVSGATPQWILWRTLQSLAYCDSQTRRMALVVEPYAQPGSTRTVQFACGTDLGWSEPRGDIVQTLEPGIMYVDINRLTDADWKQALPSLEAANGIIFDLRGYPVTQTYLGHLSESSLSSEQWHIPTPAKPDRVNFTFSQSGWSLPPLQPYLKARRVFLTDGRAISWAETVMGIVENYKLAEIVGSRTAGTNGNINPFSVPGGFTLTWTGMKVLKHDGSQHHCVGIHPTVPVFRTRKGVADGTDEVLLRGVQVVKGPQPGPTPAITGEGIVNAASFTKGPVAPGEMVTIFGSGLGPSQLAQASYDFSGYLANFAGETRVFFDNIQAPLVHASSTQVTAIVPYRVTSSTKVRVEYQLRSSNEVTLPVAAAAPGIFAYPGRTQAVVVNQDRSMNSASNPAARGEIITLFATGEGQTAPAGMDGKLLLAGNWPAPVGNLAVTFGGAPGEVQFKGVVSAGVLQVNVKVPQAAPAGTAVPLVLTVGGVSSAAGFAIALK